jgi:xanthine dehydrogenase accessory factor
VAALRAPFDPRDFDAAVVMTHNFARDAEILRQLLASQIQYIGLLGPKARGDELLVEIGALRDARLHSPVGLDLGGDTPEEIALSIVAEIQAVFERRSARSLRELTEPIHETADKPACA